MYYYGARYYDPRLSIFISVDPLAEQTMTPYQYVHNNPIMFTDPTKMNAEKIVPSKTFLSKPYGRIHNILMKSSSTYNSLLSKYKNSNDFNYYLYVNDKRKSAGSRASTEIREAYIRDKFVGIEGQTFYQDKDVDKFSEIAIAKTLIHEAAHLKIASENNTTKDDNNHDYFANENYASVIKNALMEYNDERKLGYSEEELDALSWEGSHKSAAFKGYINDKMKKNNTSYDTEYNKWKKQVEDIRYTKKEE